MIDLITKVESKHQEYILWLASQTDIDDIGDFLSYVIDKKGNYQRYLKTGRLSFIDELPRSMNRYLDEFAVDNRFAKQSHKFIEELAALISEIKKA